MNVLQAVILGIVEGLTEFLPISSTGHLILTAKLLGLEQDDFMKSFEIVIQLGAILAVAAVYWRRLLLDREILFRVLAAFVPTAVIGFALYGFVKETLLSSESVVLWALVAGGAVLVLFDLLHRESGSAEKDDRRIPYWKCGMVGVAQALSVIPGVSRSAATIVGGLALGYSRRTIVEFSFLLAVPTILGATALEVVKNRSVFAQTDWGLLATGSIVSFAVALASIKFFLRYVQNHGFLAFGVYRILLAAAFWIFG